MGYYDVEKNVKEYIENMKSFDNKYIIEELEKYLEKDSKILELGTGAGKDFSILNKKYNIIGSDNSEAFLSFLIKKYGKNKIIKLDAVDMKVNEKFDVIFSNKVLQHLNRNSLEDSFTQESKVLNENGIVFHTFWLGEGEEEYDGLIFNYYKKESIKQFYEKYFKLIKYEEYREESGNGNDSFYIVLGKK